TEEDYEDGAEEDYEEEAGRRTFYEEEADQLKSREQLLRQDRLQSRTEPQSQGSRPAARPLLENEWLGDDFESWEKWISDYGK
ncbi:MAG: hypothetical protein Q4F76_08990, partial [Lachnospiraceae bacterium]|nr:hypothetical protein [Lachnospiraceae bacterium]